MSSHIITPESNTNITRIKKIITIQKSCWLLNKFSYSSALGNVWRTVWRICILMLGCQGLRKEKNSESFPMNFIRSVLDSCWWNNVIVTMRHFPLWFCMHLGKFWSDLAAKLSNKSVLTDLSYSRAFKQS